MNPLNKESGSYQGRGSVMQGGISDSGVFRMLSDRGARDAPIVIVSACDEAASAVAAQFDFLDVRSVHTRIDGDSEAFEEGQAPLAAILVSSWPAPVVPELLDKLCSRWPKLPIVIHQHGAAEIDVRLGDHPQVVSLLQQPVRYPQLVAVLRELRLIQANGGIESARPQPELFRSLVGRSQGVQTVRSLITRIAPSEASVLVLGETGTGKEVVARNIHFHSPRRGGPFVAINCGAIPADLLESELFGHEKGAFTGAVTSRKGRFELAAGGTLFLDEIGDMPLDMQVKLLRVLQERRFERLGATRPIDADVRIVAATHRDLELMIAQGSFREDLYYRLNVVSVVMPPLRERREDLPLLIAELNAQLQRRGMSAAHFGTNALRALARHQWPGNVRELANLVERCAILAPDQPVELDDLPEKLQALVAEEERADAIGGDTGGTLPAGLLGGAGTEFQLPALGNGGSQVELKSLLEGLEMRLIRQALEETQGVVAQAAKMLGLRRTTLVEKMRKFQIDRSAEELS